MCHPSSVRFRRFAWLGSLLLAAVTLQPIPAAEIEDLYGAEVPAPETGAAAAEQALGAALQQVLVKVSGMRSPESSRVVKQAIASPGTLVQSYGVASRPDPAGGPPVNLLVASFDPPAVDRLLRDAGWPVWGRVRPGVLAWVAVQGESGRVLLGAEEAPAATRILRAAAGRRGIPLDVPLMDIEDRTRVSVDDVWKANLDVLREASARYDAEALLIGSAEQVLPTLWEVAWTLVIGDDQAARWSSRGDVLDLALEEGIGDAADAIAGRYVALAVDGVGAGISISVSGVHSLDDYARTLRYLGSLEQVQGIALERAEGDTLTLRLLARSDTESLRRVIGLGNTLAALGETEPDGFRLRP